MNNTLETSEDLNYTRNKWRRTIRSKRLKMKTSLETSEVSGYSWEAMDVRTFDTPYSEHIKQQNQHGGHYTQNEWTLKLHSKRVNFKTTLKTSEL